MAENPFDPQDPSDPTGRRARFRALEGRDGALDPGNAPLALPAEGLPFRRCARCERDHHRFATRCEGCHEDLTSPAQQAFMAGLLAQRHVQEETVRAEESARAQERLAALPPRYEAHAGFEHTRMYASMVIGALLVLAGLVGPASLGPLRIVLLLLGVGLAASYFVEVRRKLDPDEPREEPPP